MCLQTFVHCVCGHTVLSEAPCELADAHPFYLKVACPNYRISREDERRLCGSGKFYCNEDAEGQFFEQVFDIFLQTKALLQYINDLGAPHLAQLAEFTRWADARDDSPETRQAHPDYEAITSRLRTLKNQRTAILEQHQVAHAVLQEGNKLAAARAAQAKSGFSGQPIPLTISKSLRCKLSLDLQTQLAKATGCDVLLDSAITAEAIDVSNYKEGQTVQTHSHGHCETNMYHTPQQPVWPGHLPPAPQQTPCPSQSREEGGHSKLQAFTKGGRLVKRVIEQNPVYETQDSFTGRSPATKKASLTNDSSFVRRSARTRDKQVNYAESEASTTHSRENSPFKSDVDVNSPPKSDVSPSPPPSPGRTPLRRRRKVSNLKKEESRASDGNLARSNSTLTGLLEEWRRGTDVRTLQPPMPRSNSTLSAMLPGPVPQRSDWPPTAQMNATGSGLSDFQAMYGNPIYDPTAFGLMVAPQNSWPAPQMPTPVHQSWHGLFSNTNYMPSTPGPVPVPSYQQNITINQPMQSYNVTTNENAGAFQTPPNRISFDYDQLRRSFSASKDLTQPVHVDTTSVDTDPKKRSLSTSSPLPSAKRMRLSLPGDDATVASVYEQQLPYTGTSMSSPPKMASQQLPEDKGQDLSNDFIPTTPAPVFAPAAVMYAQKQRDRSGDVAAAPQAPKLADEAGGNEISTEDADHPSSDIDWGLLNDDCVWD